MTTPDPSTQSSRILTLREYQFEAKPQMSAKDFGVYASVGDGSYVGNIFEHINGVIRNTLVPSAREAWDALWEDDLDLPISFEELMSFANRMVEDEARRPTQQPSPSGPTARSTPTSSTENSDSQVAQETSQTSPSERG